MSASPSQPWLRLALLTGICYFIIGRLFPVPASNVRVWRLAAWVVSGVVFSMHIGYEHFKLRNFPRVAAWHTAVAVAIGAFLLAAAGMIRSLWTTSTMRPAWLIALVLWPVFTALPAFLLALVFTAVLVRLRQRNIS